MLYLHERIPKIVHRDLKSSNLLVDKDWNVKVGDFGISTVFDGRMMTGNLGTVEYMAPECLKVKSDLTDLNSLERALFRKM